MATIVFKSTSGVFADVFYIAKQKSLQLVLTKDIISNQKHIQTSRWGTFLAVLKSISGFKDSLLHRAGSEILPADWSPAVKLRWTPVSEMSPWIEEMTDRVDAAAAGETLRSTAGDLSLLTITILLLLLLYLFYRFLIFNCMLSYVFLYFTERDHYLFLLYIILIITPFTSLCPLSYITLSCCMFAKRFFHLTWSSYLVLCFNCDVHHVVRARWAAPGVLKGLFK